MPMGEMGGSNDTLTALPWGTQKSGAGGMRVDEQAGGGDEQKAPLSNHQQGGDAGPPWGEAGSRGKIWGLAGI